MSAELWVGGGDGAEVRNPDPNSPALLFFNDFSFLSPTTIFLPRKEKSKSPVICVGTLGGTWGQTIHAETELLGEAALDRDEGISWRVSALTPPSRWG